MGTGVSGPDINRSKRESQPAWRGRVRIERWERRWSPTDLSTAYSTSNTPGYRELWSEVQIELKGKFGRNRDRALRHTKVQEYSPEADEISEVPDRPKDAGKKG